MQNKNTRRGNTQKNTYQHQCHSRVSLSGIPTLDIQNGGDPRLRASGMTPLFNKGAFTLIELLVVVLIIGILAAIAVPQYQKAVLKARVAEAKVLLKAAVDAGDLWILQNPDDAQDRYPTWEELDVEIPARAHNWLFSFDEQDANGISACADDPSDDNTFADFAICYTSPKMTTSDTAGKWSCSSYGEQGNKTCQQLGGTLIEGYDDIYELP